MIDFGYRRFIVPILEEDAAIVVRKDEEYGGSWIRDGGPGAFFATWRKVHRIAEIAGRHANDVFAAFADKTIGEAFVDTVADLRRYLVLWEAEFRRRSGASATAFSSPERSTVAPVVITVNSSPEAARDRVRQYIAKRGSDRSVEVRPIDVMIGRLDRLLSEFIETVESKDYDAADAQTLKHHADDLIGVGRSVLTKLAIGDET